MKIPTAQEIRNARMRRNISITKWASRVEILRSPVGMSGQKFIHAMRELMTTTPGDQDKAQSLLEKQLADQLAGLDVKEGNLLDLAADGTVPQARIKARLVQMPKERERLENQLSEVETDLGAGARFIKANLALLENPYILYKNTAEEVRRRLNQAI